VEVPDDWQPAASPAAAAPAAAAAAGAADSSSQLAAAWNTDVQIKVSQAHIHIICSASSKQQQFNTSAAAAQAAADVQAVSSSSLTAADTAAALGAALSAVAARLPQHGLTWLHSCFVHLYLANMAHFGTANEVYCKHLPQVDPPSRACVQVRRVALQLANDFNTLGCCVCARVQQYAGRSTLPAVSWFKTLMHCNTCRLSCVRPAAICVTCHRCHCQLAVPCCWMCCLHGSQSSSSSSRCWCWIAGCCMCRASPAGLPAV
jgi:enamine deaminase RidA (YjgF/YER057c/UK114 family)